MSRLESPYSEVPDNAKRINIIGLHIPSLGTIRYINHKVTYIA